jgi:hypothetical protein
VFVQDGPLFVIAWDLEGREPADLAVERGARAAALADARSTAAGDLLAAGAPPVFGARAAAPEHAPRPDTGPAALPEQAPAATAAAMAPRGPEAPVPGGSSLAAVAGSASALVWSFVVHSSGGAASVALVGAGRYTPTELLLSPPVGGSPSPGSPDEGAPDAGPAPLPLAAGLLTDGVRLGVTALERAVDALTEPLGRPEAGGADVLYWVGCSSWVVAAALACEAARRCLRRHRAGEPPRLPGLLPEGEP